MSGLVLILPLLLSIIALAGVHAAAVSFTRKRCISGSALGTLVMLPRPGSPFATRTGGTNTVSPTDFLSNRQQDLSLSLRSSSGTRLRPATFSLACTCPSCRQRSEVSIDLRELRSADGTTPWRYVRACPSCAEILFDLRGVSSMSTFGQDKREAQTAKRDAIASESAAGEAGVFASDDVRGSIAGESEFDVVDAADDVKWDPPVNWPFLPASR